MGLAYITKEEHARFIKQEAALTDLREFDYKVERRKVRSNLYEYRLVNK